jgi:5-methylcytosine-specific restriction enzyme A
MSVRRTFRAVGIPGAPEYGKALQVLEPKLSSSQRAILLSQYRAPQHTTSASDLAEIIGAAGHSVVNAQYGRMGRMFCNVLGYDPDTRRSGARRWWTVLSIGYQTSAGFLWQLHPQVVQAIELVGWAHPSELPCLPEELPSSARHVLVEGSSQAVLVNSYERSRTARVACIEHFGARCVVCGFDFGRVYGSEAEGLIQVHHLRPLAEIRGEYEVDPINDLRPVCPNCHLVMHRRSPPFTPEDVQGMLRRAPSNASGGEPLSDSGGAGCGGGEMSGV